MRVGQHWSSVQESLCFALCTPVAALSPMVLKLHTPTPHPHQWRGFLVCGNFSSFTAPSQRCRSHPYSFVCFFFCPTQVCGDFLAFWDVWGLLPAFRRYSVGVLPHVDVFLMYLWEGRWSPHLTPLPSWRSPPRVLLHSEEVNVHNEKAIDFLLEIWTYTLSTKQRIPIWLPSSTVVPQFAHSALRGAKLHRAFISV